MPYFLLIFILVGSSVYLLSTQLLLLRERRRPLLAELSLVAKRKKFGFSSAQTLKSFAPLRPLYNLAYLKKLQLQLEALKININIDILILLKVFMVFLVGGLIFILFSPLYALPGSLVGFFLPDLMLMHKIKVRKQAIVSVFPETIDLLDLCIGAGLDFAGSIKWIIDKAQANAFVEHLRTVSSEIHVGKTQVQALKDMAKRLNIPDISSFVRSVVQAERMGTALEEVFRNLSEDTRMARFQAGERYAIKASLKILFPLLFCILPVILIVVAGPVIIQFMQGGLVPKGVGGF